MYLSRNAAFKYSAKETSDGLSTMENKCFNKLEYVYLLHLRRSVYVYQKHFLSSIHRGHSTKVSHVFNVFTLI